MAERVREKPYPPWPYIEEEAIERVANVLRSGKINYWTGEEVKEFEQKLSKLTECEYAVALANGTVALEAALSAVGVGDGDEVIVPPRTFIATASSVVRQGAIPVFADVDPVSGNITADTIREVMTSRTKAVIVVHLGGWPCDMDPILELAKKNGLRVIEDCAQAHGAKYKGRPVGSFSDVAAWSFCQDKIITTGGEGGAITTNDREIWNHVWSLKDHGKDFETVFYKDHPPGFRWLHHSFGTNLRISEMQAAVGNVMLEKLDSYVARRRENAAILEEGLEFYDFIEIFKVPKDFYHSYYRYYAKLVPDRMPYGLDRQRFIEAVSNKGVPCMVGSCSEIYLEEAFKKRGLGPKERLKNARDFTERAICFLVHPTAGSLEMNEILEAVKKVVN